MGKLSIPALALAIYMGTTAMIATGNRTVASSVSSEATLAVDGAFRDGLYLGKLAAAGGQTLRPPIGRWSTDRDRSLFAAGYRCGYQSLAVAMSAHATD